MISISWTEADELLLIAAVSALKNAHLTVAIAESCTGGLLASLFTSLPGSSVYFSCGFITYSNVAKEKILHVQPSLLEAFGAVSEETAQAMAQGALAVSGADIAIAVTGIAGPAGGSLQKPVGTVWVAYASNKNNLLTHRLYFPEASRQEVRLLTCRSILKELPPFILSINSKPSSSVL